MGVCIDRFRFEIDQDIRNFAPAFPVAGTSVRQVLSHATGGRFRYDASLYSALTPVAESKECFSRNFRQAMATEVFDRLTLTRSVPGLDLDRADGAAARALFDDATVRKYQAVLADVAVPYRIGCERPQLPLGVLRRTASTRPTGWSRRPTISRSSQIELEQAVTACRSVSPRSTRCGATRSSPVDNTPPGDADRARLVRDHESGQRLVWTFGHIPDAGSALIVKVTSQERAGPARRRRLTLILLANSGGLVQGYDLENAQRDLVAVREGVPPAVHLDRR